jgi:C_GCAxxG_C_C family probable redox protein
MGRSISAKVERLMKENEILELFEQGFDCGQVVLSSLSEKLGLPEEQANKLAACFGGGMFNGDACGAVVGALMAIGLKYGNFLPDTPEEKLASMAKANEFRARFLERYNSTVCRELLAFDIGKPEELEIILQKGLLVSFCPKVVAYAIEILEDIFSAES